MNGQDARDARRVAGSRDCCGGRAGARRRFRLEEIPGQDRHLSRQQQSGVAGAADLQGRFREADRHDPQGRRLSGTADAPASGHRHECAQRRGRRVHDAAVARGRAVRRRRLVRRSLRDGEERSGQGIRLCRAEPGAAQGRDLRRQADQHAHEHRRPDLLLPHRHLQEVRSSRRRRPSRTSKRRREKIKTCDSTDDAVRLARPEARGRLYLQQHAAQYRRQLYRERQVEPLLAKGKEALDTYSRLLRDYRSARRRQLQLPADFGALSQRPRRDVRSNRPTNCAR